MSKKVSKVNKPIPEITEEEIIAGEKLADEEIAKEGNGEEEEEEEEEPVLTDEAEEIIAPVNPATGESVVPPGTPQPVDRDNVPRGTQDSIPGPDAVHP